MSFFICSEIVILLMANNILKFIYKHRNIIFSWRLILPAFCAILAAVWLFVILFDWVTWFGFSINLNLISLPLPVYVLWFLVIFLSCFFAFKVSPAENKLLNSLESALLDLRAFDAKKYIQEAYRQPFLLPKARVELGLLEASFNVSQGEIGQALEKLQQLKSLPLLPCEHVDVDLDLAKLFFTSGNFKETQEILDQLKECELSKNQRYKYVRSQVELLLARSEFQAAKDLLERQLLESNLSASMKVSLLHTLGVAESHLKNYVGVIAAYRKAWGYQKNLKSSFGQAEITIDNLVLTYAKQGQTEHIQPLLYELEALASLNNVDHLLALNNIKLNLARQLGDRQALIATYQEAVEKILPKLDDNSKFCYLVNGLRMHWNDGVEFFEVFQKTQAVMLNRPDLSPLNTLRCIREVCGTVRQAIDKIGQRPDLMIFYSWLILEFKNLEPEVDRLLENTSPSLPVPKNELISLKIESIKNSFSYQPPNKILFERLFELLNEKRSIWQGMDNSIQQLNELMIILDEYSAFKNQLVGTVFQQVFEQAFTRLASNTLDDAEQLLNHNQQNLACLDKLIGLAYACYQLNVKKPQAKKWLEIFDQSKQSQNHMAAWLREQYQQTKAWVSEG